MGIQQVSRLLAVGTLTLLLSACSSSSDPVAEIEANVAAMENALAERDNGDFIDHLADSFLGGRDGRMDIDKADARKMLAGYFLRYRNIHIVVTQMDIEIHEMDPYRARMSGTVAVAGASRSLPESGGLYKVEGEWQNYDGSWQLGSFNWR